MRHFIYTPYGWLDRVVIRQHGMTLSGLVYHTKFDTKRNTFMHKVGTEAGVVLIPESDIVTKVNR